MYTYSNGFKYFLSPLNHNTNMHKQKVLASTNASLECAW